MNMNTAHWSVARWVLIVFWIFASLQRSDAIRWTRRPEKPTILVEGVNNTGAALVWDFEVEISETVERVIFLRQRDVANTPVVIAIRTFSTAFTLFPQFISNYSARLPATLILRNAVTSDEDFIYSIQVSLLRNNIPAPSLKDRVQVIVKALSTSPTPKIIAPSQAQSTRFPTSSVSLPVYHALRLVGGRWPGEGRVEIYYRGSWGTVCDDYWDINDARVVCRQLGYPSAVSALHRARFGQGSGKIWLDDVQCQGYESSIAICRHRPWGVHNCVHSEDASVICSNYSIPLPSASSVSPTAASTQFPVSSVSLPVYGDVRLVGGNWSGEGRVEIYYRGSWGTVCDNDWDIRDARVVCRQLGYSSAVSAPKRAHFGQGTGEIWLSNVWCEGYENSIVNCSYYPRGVQVCSHRDDASVICSHYSIPFPSASSVSPTAATPTGWPLASTTPTPRPSPTRPRFAFTISCYPSAMVAYIARDSLPLGSDPRLLHLNNPSCGVNYVTKKSVIIKAPLKGCGTVRRNIGYKVSFHNKVVVPFGYGNKRSLSVYPFKCVYSHFGFP